MTDLDTLRGMVSDLEARVNRISAAGPSLTPVAGVEALDGLPYWSVTLAPGITLSYDPGALTTPDEDWDPLFDAYLEDDRTDFRIATAGGEIPTFGTHGRAYPKRYVIQWDSDFAGQVHCCLSGFYTEAGDTDMPIQLKVNGSVRQLYPTPQDFVVDFKEGRNRVVLTMRERPILMTLAAMLFDGRGRRWVDLKQ